MENKASCGSGSGRRGFTLIELLVAMAMIVFIMSILSQNFVNGLETFRHLKAVGDMDEKLRAAAISLREDVLAAHFSSEEFVRDGLRTKTVDPIKAAELRALYEGIHADACDLRERFRELELKTVNPPAKRILGRALGDLDSLKTRAAQMVWLLEVIEQFGTFP
jgi:prepilin-type N-terminal cleavage/methylation domain-containing protein